MQKVIFGIRVIEVIIVLLALGDSVSLFYHYRRRDKRAAVLYLIGMSIILGSWFTIFNIFVK